MKPPAHPVTSLSLTSSAPLTDDANTLADCKSEARRYIACSGALTIRVETFGTDATVIVEQDQGRRMTPGHVESEAACVMCALTLSAPVRGTEMGAAAAAAGGCLCAQT